MTQQSNPENQSRNADSREADPPFWVMASIVLAVVFGLALSCGFTVQMFRWGAGL